MAVTGNPKSSSLRLVLQVGTDNMGNPRLANKSLSGCKATAPDQDLYDVATALAGLQLYPLAGVQRVNEVELILA